MYLMISQGSDRWMKDTGTPGTPGLGLVTASTVSINHVGRYRLRLSKLLEQRSPKARLRPFEACAQIQRHFQLRDLHDESSDPDYAIST